MILGERLRGWAHGGGPADPSGAKTNGVRNQFLRMGHRTSAAATLKATRAESRAALPALPPAHSSQGPPEAADVTTNNPSLCVGVGGGRDRLNSSFSSGAARAPPTQRSSLGSGAERWLGRHSWWTPGCGGWGASAVRSDGSLRH